MAINDYLSGINQATAPAQANVNAAAADLANLQAGAGSLPAKLKEALNTKLNNNKDIINQQADTMGAYFNAGPQAREKYQDVFDPFKKASLVQNERTMALRPYDVLSGVLENRMGQVSDIVDSGVQGWQGLVNAAGTKAELAKSNLATALQSYMQAVGMQENEDTRNLQASQFDRSYGLDLAKFKESQRQFDIQSSIERSKSGGGSVEQQTSDAKDIADFLMGSGLEGADFTSALIGATNDKNIGLVSKEINKLKASSKAAEQAEVDRKNAELKANSSNSPVSKLSSWVSNYFKNNAYTPTIYGGYFSPKQ